jgi:hypothetical protein
MVDHGEELFVRTTYVVSVGLAHIDVDHGFMFGWCHFRVCE